MCLFIASYDDLCMGTPINQPTAGMTHDFERYSLDFVRSKSFLLCISNMFSILSSPTKWIGSGKSFSFLL